VHELLTHYSGLRPGLDPRLKWSGYDGALKTIIEEKPVCVPGTQYIYSDINFIILGELVRRISGKPLDQYCLEHIFIPLGMRDTGFKPSLSLHHRIAPTEYKYKDKKKMFWGEVHDPQPIAWEEWRAMPGFFPLLMISLSLLKCFWMEEVPRGLHPESTDR